ncbi:MAG: hypothetical protein J7599_21905 [Niabella sp.]|nr:hypothetical protein [Niabella sp.]
MKARSVLIFLLFVTLSGFGRPVYTLSKKDFILQFTGIAQLKRLYCFNEAGVKVWLMFNENTQLTVQLRNTRTRVFLLHTVRYQDDTIDAVEYNVWWPTKKRSLLPMDAVVSFTIERRFGESGMPYFNIDSARALSRQKNDSLNRVYTGGSEQVLYWFPKNAAGGDTIAMRENACYSLVLKNGNRTEFGVVQKITGDSVYISNLFNARMAAAGKKAYMVYPCLIRDIAEFRLLRSGGFSYRTISLDGYAALVKNTTGQLLRLPCWFAMDPTTGDVSFYRSWLTDRGFVGITEKDGKAIWYEGESTE